MTTKLKLLTFGIILLTVTSCKKPSANFTSDKTEYTNGESIILSNTSTNYSSCKWTGTGIDGELTSKDIEIKTDTYGIYTINLTVYSKNKKHSTTFSKTINVKKATGQVLFYTLSPITTPYPIKINNVDAGSVTQTYSSTPDCGAAGCVTATLEEGNQNFSMIINGLTVPFQTTITPHICNKMKIN